MEFGFYCLSLHQTLKKSAHNGTISKKIAYLCTVIPKNGRDYIEESNEAFARQRIWKIRVYGVRSGRAVPHTVVFIPHPFWGVE